VAGEGDEVGGRSLKVGGGGRVGHDG
jgi:hypothetical protein